MTSEFDGKTSTMPRHLLVYWMEERERIRLAKEKGLAKPWSTDPVFQTVYFCNVDREHDKVTRWIRDFYSPHVNNRMFEYNIILSRFVNRIETLKYIGYQMNHEPEELQSLILEAGDVNGKIWGGAYLVSTNGVPMGKVAYVVDMVMERIEKLLDTPTRAGAVRQAGTLLAAHKALQSVDGLGSFMAAQVVADLKNTPDHPLMRCEDWWTFVAPGPGSLRGAAWFHYGNPNGVTPSNFHDHFEVIRDYVNENYSGETICNQNLQNCLCEFDKYMRVRNGTGRSKRYYSGS